MDEDLYDEFGNYIGPELDENLIVEKDALVNCASPTNEDQEVLAEEIVPIRQALVLHEDKQYYPEAQTIYGPNVKISIQEEDTQSIHVPIVQPQKLKKFDYIEKLPPNLDKLPWYPTEYTKSYFESFMKTPRLIRHVAIIGALHHGKTVLLDSLVHQTHADRLQIDPDRNERFTDVSFDEQERGLSIKCRPVSLLLPNLQEKNFLINFLDTPGHVNFVDEVTSALRICDGVMAVVDVLEGLTPHLEHLLQHAIQNKLDLTLVVNKIDRLILELKLPPLDAYHKICYVIEEINHYISSIPVYVIQDEKVITFSPAKGNVIFASGEHGWSFSLLQFAKLYVERYKIEFDYQTFAVTLWGDVYYDSKTRSFSTKNTSGDHVNTFVFFVLEPIYKLYAQIVAEDFENLTKVFDSFSIPIFSDDNLDVRPLLKLLTMRFFGPHYGLVDMLSQNISNPIDAGAKKIPCIFSGDSEMADVIKECNPHNILAINIVKLYFNKTSTGFYALGRVFSGSIGLGDKVRVLGETFNENEEDTKIETITGVFTYNSRYFISHGNAPAGNWVTLEGVDDIISKTATITQLHGIPEERLFTFLPLRFSTLAVIKIAVEPLNPAELPKLVDGLRNVNKTYPLLTTRVEESGERIILGTGELYLDCVMYDLRKVFTDIEIKVAEPVVTFCETVIEASSIQCYAETPNKQNRLSMIAQPLEPGLAEDIDRGKIVFEETDTSSMQNYLKETYQWDSLAVRNIWAFGPDSHSPNILINEILPYEIPPHLSSIKDHVIRGFKWASKEGPLCEEPMRNLKFRLINASIAEELIYRGGNQIIPTSRRVIYSSFLTATPRLMEPVYCTDILAPENCYSAIELILSRRRGHIVDIKPKAGTPLHAIKAYIPCIDSFGFETDLRTHTQGQAFCLSFFDHWALVPGNPLDESVILKVLEPAPTSHLSRDFMLKTRRRKGLGQNIAMFKFFDESLLEKLKEAEIDILNY